MRVATERADLERQPPAVVPPVLGHTGVVSGLGTTGLVANSVGPSGQGSGLGGNTLSVWISGVLTLANIIECTVAG